ncbi:MAG: MFS transporter [Bacteroidales bacterium]|nr:MFS transporter [Bacteroidales bacterium]
MVKKPKLSFWQIWNMSFGFLGIQFGFALQNANVSRIFETLGASVDEIPILWIAAPVTGLIIQPIIGHMSDHTWGKLGRRRPFFLIGAILASLALIAMPNSAFLWMAAGLLWIMDASINISMEPFRAFVGDMLPDEQRTKGFAMQSFFIGTGAVVASALPYILTNWLGVPNVDPDGGIPPSVRWSFYLGAFAFFSAVAVTVFTTKEYSPEELSAFEESEKQEIRTDDSNEEKRPRKIRRQAIIGAVFVLLGVIFTPMVYTFDLDKELYIFTIGSAFFGLVFFISAFLQMKGKNKNGFVEVVGDFLDMPKTMVQLAVVQFFSWFALFAMWIYTTSAVTEHIFGTTDSSSQLYNDGADWVGIMFAAYNGFAALVAFGLPVLARWTNRKITHMIALVIGGLGLISVYFFNDPYWLILSMLAIGVAWASILSMPYAILTGALPAKKMGVYMGIFNFFIVIPQIFAASILGFFTRNLFHDKAIFALVLGGFSMILAAVFTVFVDDITYEKPVKNK